MSRCGIQSVRGPKGCGQPVFRALQLLALLAVNFGMTVETAAEEVATILRRGYFAEITDAATRNYTIEAFRMSRDGSRAVFLVTEKAQDPRGCLTRRQLRTIKTDGTSEEIVEQGFTYDTGVGNGCATSLDERFDVSDDGTTIAYTRLSAPTDLTQEITVYNTVRRQKVTLLKHLPHRSYGTTDLHNLDLSGGLDRFRLCGDGRWLFFINRYGYYGEPGTSGDPGPDGFTLYRVATNGTGAQPVFANRNLSQVAGVDPQAVEIGAIGCYIDANSAGSFVALPIGGNYPSANPPRQVLGMNPANGPATARVLLNYLNGGFYAASLSADGSKMAFARTGVGALNGLYVMNTDLLSPAVRIDPGTPTSGRMPRYPRISGDGFCTVHVYELGGGSEPSLRWGYARRASPSDAPVTMTLPLSYPLTHVKYNFSAISRDGNRVLFMGAVMPDTYSTGTRAMNLVRFDWRPLGAAPWTTAPAVTKVVGRPSVLLVQQPTIWNWQFNNDFFYTTTGPNRAHGYSFVYNSEAVAPRGINDFEETGWIADDGAFEGTDQVAGDGIYSDGNVVVSSAATPATYTLRAGIAAYNRRAGFSDVHIRVLPIPTKSDIRSIPTGNTPPTVLGATKITADFQTNAQAGTLRGEYFYNRLPPSLPGASREFWNISGLNDGQFSVSLTFAYSEDALSSSGLNERHVFLQKSDDSGLTWKRVESITDHASNTISTVTNQSAFSLWAIASSACDSRYWYMYN